MPDLHVAEPRVSVIITAYNSAAFIDAAVKSVLAQTRPVDQIVVIDDGSTDETAARVAAFTSAGVRYVHQKNQGAGSARNRGIDETTGELIAFLDGDDIWLPDKIARQVAYLITHPEIALVSGAAWWWDVGSNRCSFKPVDVGPYTNIGREIVIRNFVGNPSKVLLRRAVLGVTGPFDPSLRWGQEDWELWMRIVSCAKVGFIPDPVIVYRWHAAGLSHQRQWERIAQLFETSQRAIDTLQPAWWRPILRLRAWSNAELSRAHYARQHRFPRWQQAWHAGWALNAYPFEDTAEKFKMVGHSLIGEEFYGLLRGLTRLRRRTSHG